jgi:hypothetical protein
MENSVLEYKKTVKERSDIKGWGVDANPENNPTYPMRDRSKEAKSGYNWERSLQQPENLEILHSNERPNTSAVFGTSVPPSGLSGQIRRFAFRFSEGSFGHWIPLILADRVNVIEGIIDDLKKGHIPNIIAERGWTAEWKYNRKNLIRNVAIGAAVGGVALAIILSTKKKSSNYKI